MNWYNRLIKSIEIPATGVVAGHVKAALPKMLEKVPFDNSLDTSVSEDVCQWFEAVLEPWFAELSASLEIKDTGTELSSEGYTYEINKIITALMVSRSWYQTKANEGFMTSLKTVAGFKALICEELATAVATAYTTALDNHGEWEGKTIIDTVSSEYTGTTPEKFTWNNTVGAYHTFFERVQMVGYAAREKRIEAEAEEKEGKKPASKNYVPWVVAGIFGLVALNNASTK